MSILFSHGTKEQMEHNLLEQGLDMGGLCENLTLVLLQKRSFVVMKDEIETIISCQTPDGAGPLLERMYKFLTMKR